MQGSSYWDKRTFCLVTGASKGIGKCIATEFSKKVGKGSLFLLLARSTDGLKGTMDVIESRNTGVKVAIAQVDLGKLDSYQPHSVIEVALKECGMRAGDFEHAMIVQNAASLGIESGLKVEEMGDLKEIKDYYDFNLHSFILLNSAFFTIFNPTSVQRRSIVHISSEGVVAPFKTWGLYCAAKAARDTLVKSLALESGIHALNWSPGCVNTDIYQEAVAHTGDKDLASFFEEYRQAGKVLTCEQTVSKLMRVLAQQKFVKGEHVKYDDVSDHEDE